MQISAALVKELRERTGAGMMECKKALQENNGDIEAAIEAMRIAGQAKAAKKAGRIAAEGVIATARSDKRVAMVEVNCETDFVSKGDEFQDFAKAVAESVLNNAPADVGALGEAPISDAQTVEKRRQELIAKIGENMSVRRFHLLNGQGDNQGVYQHGVRIGVVVDMQGGTPELAKDIAMHIAASKPVCVSAEQVPAELLDKEREIFAAQAKESGKPDNIIEKMVEGRIKKYLAEVTLLGQPFVKDPDQSVEKLLKTAGATVLSFSRFEVGEGIEKKTENFADEVMQQAGLK
jgi:elongation factor Ts